jgi:hypothetical protein
MLMQLSFIKKNLSGLGLLAILIATLLWACGGNEANKEETPEVTPPVVVTDSIPIDTTIVDTTGTPKDPGPRRN